MRRPLALSVSLGADRAGGFAALLGDNSSECSALAAANEAGREWL